MLWISGSVLLAAGVAGALAAVLLAASPGIAQSNSNGADAYQAGVKHGHSLKDARQYTGSGDYHDGCVDGVEESRFDREADRAMKSIPEDSKPAERAPLLSPSPGLFHPPFSKPDDGAPPN